MTIDKLISENLNQIFSYSTNKFNILNDHSKDRMIEDIVEVCLEDFHITISIKFSELGLIKMDSDILEKLKLVKEGYQNMNRQDRISLKKYSNNIMSELLKNSEFRKGSNFLLNCISEFVISKNKFNWILFRDNEMYFAGDFNCEFMEGRIEDLGFKISTTTYSYAIFMEENMVLSGSRGVECFPDNMRLGSGQFISEVKSRVRNFKLDEIL